MMTLPLVYLCRHGETAWSKSGQHTGKTDLQLTEEGLQEAASLKSRISAVTFAHVLSSPMKRALQTCASAGLSPEIWDEVTEWDYGDYEGMTTSQIHSTVPDWAIFTHGAPNGETPKAIAARVDRVIARLRALEGPIALFSHGHFLRVLGARWIGLPVTGGAHLALGTAALSILGSVRDLPALVLWNEVSG